MSRSATDFQRLTQQYTGTVAQQYDARRTGTVKWQREQAIVERLLSGFPPGSSLVDIPVGTGRFLPLYEQFRINATGMDVSVDMLARAREKNADMALRVSDIRHISAGDGEYDCALCVRFLNWVDAAGLAAAVGELARVSRQHVILSVRHYALPAGMSLKRRVRQRWARRQVRAEGQIVVHDFDTVQDAFRRAGLRIESAAPVEQSPDGTDYCIYDLTRSDGSA